MSAAWLITMLAPGCAPGTLEPYGELILEVDTDMPVPRFVGSLRVDLYDDRGAWRFSQVHETASEDEWPLSFSLLSRDVDESVRSYLRLRAFPSGRTRPYRGERYEPRPTYRPPLVPESLEELHEQAPTFTPPAVFGLRRGSTMVTTLSCGVDETFDAVNGVHVEIEQAGRYRFEKVGTFPAYGLVGYSRNVLSLRRFPGGEPLGCIAQESLSPSASDHPELVVDLEEGTYTFLVGSHRADPIADVLVEVTNLDQPESDEEQARPLLEGDEPTPTREPQPSVTIDRLFVVDLTPGQVLLERPTLRGACVGTMAKLGDGQSAFDPAAAATCVDQEASPVPLGQAGWQDGSSAEAPIGSQQDCRDIELSDNIACMPSGTMLLGDQDLAGALEPLSTTPERVVRLSRFFLDRHEVTVGAYRAAIEAGLIAPPASPADPKNNPNELFSSENTAPQCTWIADPAPGMDREAYPLNCISYAKASEFCRAFGGALPTEAQWEYAATAASLESEVVYPWGEATLPTCDQAVFGRWYPPEATNDLSFKELSTRVSRACRTGDYDYGPLPIDDERNRADRTSLGVFALGGNVSEWVQDAAYPYDHPCWTSQPLDNPRCVEPQPPLRAFRGGSWAHGPYWLAGAIRSYHLPPGPHETGIPLTPHIGFRCAYAQPPSEAHR